jgi:branched-chain amino acid transport system permease protein
VARSFAAPEVQWILYGLFMILIVFVLPAGIVPAIEKLFAGRKKDELPAAAKIQDAP